MRNILLCSAALALTVSAAEAQDGGYNWSGFYAGVQAGYGRLQSDFSGTNAIPSGQESEDGFVGGVYVGHDWQSGNFVFGALADLDYLDTDNIGLEGIFNGKDEAYNYDVDWMATARVRAGFLPMDNILVYGTGGLAMARVETSGSRETFGPTFSFDDSEVEIGGAIGAGVEVALTPKWSIKTEYLHYEFNDSEIDVGLGDNPTFNPSADTVKVGLTFRLGQ